MIHPHPATSLTDRFRRSLLPRALVLVLACATACSQPVSNSPDVASAGTVTGNQTAPNSAQARRDAPSDVRKEGGTGTRAKGEESAQPSTPTAEPEAAHDDFAATPPPGLMRAPTSKPAEKKSADGALADQMYESVSGLGAAPSSGAGYGVGHGRLAGSATATAPKVKARGAYVPAPTAQAPVQATPEFNTEGYEHITENRFLKATDQPLSTFSIDVDTASYSNARRFLSQGSLPPKDAIRVEEWLNYFSYDYAGPTDEKPFAVHSEISQCPWNEQHKLVRIGIKGKTLTEENVPPRNLVFLLDVSGSMDDPNKLPLVKEGLSMLTHNLRPQDSIAMVVYAGASGLVLPATSGKERGRILAALDQLQAGGSTNGGDGIRLAYSVAQQSFKKGGINRVILATDGDFNVGTTSEGELTRLIEDKRKSGVFLTVLGFGTGNVKDNTMEMLADKGNGNYAYIDTAAEANKVLVREAGSTLITIAKDVKLQVEFNPARVQSYKLIGYENRVLAKEDFNDDKKDAGEIGAGHSVTALYEIVPVGAPNPAVPSVDPLKYQATGALSPAAAGGELMTVAVRYKQPTSDTSTKFSVVVNDNARPLAEASTDYRFGVAVANIALLLRGSPDVKAGGLAAARALAASAIGTDAHGDRREFLGMVDRASTLSRKN
jgi:Ca-activated chloride channel family protein